jgi:predicted phosphodiesterase
MSRIAVLSDIHGNLPALEAVLRDVQERRVETLWYLGDVVVYGPQPGACVDRLRAACEQWPSSVLVRGNNDHAIIQELQAQRGQSAPAGGDWLVRAGIVDPSDPKEAERHKYVVATELSHAWTVEQLAPEQQDWLLGLASTAQRPLEHVLLVHASPCDPVGEEGSYLHDTPDAEEAWLSLEQPLCFFGHTHSNVVFRRAVPTRLYDNTERIARPTDPIPVDGHSLLVNPGSVGQPRDGLAAANYAIYDTAAQHIEFYRVAYDVAVTIRALESTRQGLEKVVQNLNARSADEPKPYRPEDAVETIKLLSTRLQEAR